MSTPDDHAAASEFPEGDQPFDDEELADDAVPLCPNCLTANDPAAHFCVQCGAPLTSHAAIDPLGQVYAQGHIYRNAVYRSRSLFVFVGMWILFLVAGLSIILGIFSVLHAMLGGEGKESSERIAENPQVIIGLLFASLVAAVYFLVLSRFTIRFIQRRREASRAGQ